MIGSAGKTFGVWALCLAAAGTTGSQLSAQTDHPAKHRGRAIVEFHDKAMHAVVAYNYSQRNHDSRWILIQSALTTSKESIVHRSDIVLRTPQGQ